MENEIINLLGNRFGINIDDLDVKFVMSKDKVYICSNDLADLEFRGMQRKGMIAFKFNTLFGTKPSLDFVLMFGYLTKKNYVVFNGEEILEMYEGKEIEKNCECEDGLVIVKDNENKGIGIVFKKENVLKSLIPKNRFIHR
jgi:NOL1/NOP2/fmu family ribosome biogenesis protein